MGSERWGDYVLEEDFYAFWRERSVQANLRLLVIFGLGFDPRSLTALALLSRLGLGDRLGYIALKLVSNPAPGQAGTATDRLVQSNLRRLEELTGCYREAIHDIHTRDEEGHNLAGRRTLSCLADGEKQLAGYTDVLVDISGMPRGMFFPLIAYLIRLADRRVFPNLHVSVVEDPALDGRISGREYGQADYLHTFRHQGDGKVVWLPLVGRNEVARLEKIHNKIRGSCVEICPILPFPAGSLRRADDIAVTHSELLFEGFLVSPENIILCDESNPFDVYRKVLDVERYYRSQLGAVPAIGAVTTIASPLSSKTLSLGVLLAAVERSLPVCHVEAGTYQLDLRDGEELTMDDDVMPTEIWLAGEPYDA